MDLKEAIHEFGEAYTTYRANEELFQTAIRNATEEDFNSPEFQAALDASTASLADTKENLARVAYLIFGSNNSLMKNHRDMILADAMRTLEDPNATDAAKSSARLSKDLIELIEMGKRLEEGSDA